MFSRRCKPPQDDDDDDEDEDDDDGYDDDDDDDDDEDDGELCESVSSFENSSMAMKEDFSYDLTLE